MLRIAPKCIHYDSQFDAILYRFWRDCTMGIKSFCQLHLIILQASFLRRSLAQEYIDKFSPAKIALIQIIPN